MKQNTMLLIAAGLALAYVALKKKPKRASSTALPATVTSAPESTGNPMQFSAEAAGSFFFTPEPWKTT